MTAGPGRRSLEMVGNAHLDAVWLWPWQEGYGEARATIRAALDRLDEDPDFIFTCDSIAYYEWVQENDAALFERVRARVAEGRWEPTGGWWVEPDCNIPSGESFVRQGLYGQRYLLEHFGRIATVGMNVDPFGHAGSLPQILLGLGLDSYVFHRPGAHELGLPAPLFWWRSADGSRVLAYRIPHEYCSPSGDVGNHIDRTLTQLPEGSDGLMCFYGVGNHGGGPTRQNLASIRRIGATVGQPELRFSSPGRFFARMRHAGTESVPVVDGELQHHAVGCYSAHSGIKAWNRRAEHLLASAETWSTIEGHRDGGGSDDRAVLGQAWKQLAFNQFHDILAGSALESTYLDARDQLGEVAAIAARVANRAIQRIARDVDIAFIEGTQPLLVFNPLPWPTRSTVELEFGAHGGFENVEVLLTDAQDRPVEIQRTRSEAVFPDRRRLVFESDVPAFGYRLYRLWPEGLRARRSPLDQLPRPRRRPRLRATDTRLENDHLRAVIDPSTGWLRELVHRGSGASIVARATPHAVVLDDASDTWGHRVARYDDVRGHFEVRSVRLVEAGPVQAVIRVESSYERSTLIEELMLSHDARCLRVRVSLDWQQHQQMLKLRVATALSDVLATYEIPYGHVVRAADGHEESGQAWLDVAGVLPGGQRAGLSVLNDAKYAFDVLEGDVGITAARSPVYAWHIPMTLEPDGVYSYQDQGLQRFSYALLPHDGDWRTAGTVIAAADLNRRPTPLLEAAHPGSQPALRSFAAASRPSVAVTVIKRSEDPGDDVIVRAYETTGVDADVVLDLPFLRRTITATFAAHAIRTFRVPADETLPVVETDLLERPSAWPHAG